MSNALKHAKHNKSACEYLNETALFGDWVITTAYYSAIYFVCHTLFPNQYDIKGRVSNYNTFEEYYRAYRQINQGMELNPHKLRLELVEEFIPEVATSYKTLKDQCWTARYVNYKFDKSIVAICKECLNEIERICV